MLQKYEFEKIADDISNDYINKKVPLNDSVKIVSIRMNLNPEQIKRLSEASNIQTYNKIYDKLEDKTFDFDLADSKKIIDDVYSNEDEKVEIKDMPPVEYKAEKNPKNPEHNYEILGDDDEIEVSKNTRNSEDAASDHYIDALKVPKKDYSYAENEFSEVEENNLDDEDDSDSTKDEGADDDDYKDIKDDEEDLKYMKEASLQENETSVLQELEHRSMILSDNAETEIRKLASLFRSHDKISKFKSFIKNAALLYADTPSVHQIILDTAKHAEIPTDIKIERPTTKYASETDYGMKQLSKVVSIWTELNKVNSVHEFMKSRDK